MASEASEACEPLGVTGKPGFRTNSMPNQGMQATAYSLHVWAKMSQNVTSQSYIGVKTLSHLALL
jgi:hypothetical protein